MIFQFMYANKTDCAIQFMAARLGVSKSGFYEWRRRQVNPCRQARAEAKFTMATVEIWSESRGTYGARMIWAESCGSAVTSRWDANGERVMRHAEIEGVYRRRR